MKSKILAAVVRFLDTVAAVAWPTEDADLGDSGQVVTYPTPLGGPTCVG